MSYQRILQCRLTEDEQRERGQALALARGERNEREADRKAKAAALKALVDEADEEVDRLAAIVRSGQEPRPVECLDRVHGYEVVTVRLDTGEEVSRRAATDADRQMALPMEPERSIVAKVMETSEALESLRPREGSGIDAVTITSKIPGQADRSVTLTPKKRDKAAPAEPQA